MDSGMSGHKALISKLVDLGKSDTVTIPNDSGKSDTITAIWPPLRPSEQNDDVVANDAFDLAEQQI
jgi:hypothetical protein